MKKCIVGILFRCPLNDADRALPVHYVISETWQVSSMWLKNFCNQVGHNFHHQRHHNTLNFTQLKFNPELIDYSKALIYIYIYIYVLENLELYASRDARTVARSLYRVSLIFTHVASAGRVGAIHPIFECWYSFREVTWCDC